MITIGVLTQDDPLKAESIRILENEARNQNAKIKVIHPSKIDYLISRNTNLIKDINILYPRLYAETNFEEFLLSIAGIQHYLNLKVPMINTLEGLIIGSDKFRQYQVISNAGVSIPKTSLIASNDMINTTLKNFNFPIILKRQFGFGGSYVAIAESEKSAKSVIGSFLSDKHPVLVQEYLKLDRCVDYRVYIVGGKAEHAKLRTAPKGDFRANVALGGTQEYFKPPQELCDLAEKVAKAVNLELFAADFLKLNNKYYLVEINRSMSFDPYEGKHKIVAKKAIEFILDKLNNN